MNKKELSIYFAKLKETYRLDRCWSKELEDGYQQIVALIKKSEVTEEWIGEKAKQLRRWMGSERGLDYRETKDFIRLLMEDVSITVDPHGKSGK